MKTNWIWRTASIAALALAAGCSSPELADTAPPAEVAPPPPPSAAYVPPPASSGRIETTELLGGPAPTTASAAPRQDFTPMKPIPNPRGVSRTDRPRAPARPPVATSSRPAYAATAPGPVSRPTPVLKPAAPQMAAPKPAPKAVPPVAAPKPVPAPAVVAAKPAAPKAAVRETPKPANAAQVATAKPVPAPAPKALPPVAAPQAKAPPAKAAVPAKPKTKAEQLGLAVASDITGASTFVLPPELTEGKPGVVSLTLAPTLSDRITAEAARLGLSREARTADARATLSGEGYTIIPSASQSARLKAGEATTFNWQVTPAEGAKGPLKADVSGDLKGGAKPQPFAIAALEETPAAPVVAEKKGLDLSALKNLFKSKTAPAPETAPAEGAAPAEPAAASGVLDKLSLPGMSNIDLPVVGVVKSSLLVVGALGFLALMILLAILSRASSRRRAAQRRRKFRTMTEFQAESEPEPTAYREPAPVPAPVPVHYSPAPEPVHYSPAPEPVHYAPPPETVITPPPAPRAAPVVEVAQPADRKEDEHA